MSHIARRGGRFVTVLPRTRREDALLRDWAACEQPDFIEAARRPGKRKADPDSKSATTSPNPSTTPPPSPSTVPPASKRCSPATSSRLLCCCLIERELRAAMIREDVAELPLPRGSLLHRTDRRSRL